MSGLKKILIVIGSVIALATGLNLYFQYQNHQEHMQLKTSFEERDNIAVLQRLMASGKYAPDIRKAGYVIPPDGAIRLDGGIASIEIKGDIDLKISYRGRGVTAYFEIEIDGKITSVLYELDKNLDIVSSAYFQTNEKNKNERVTIPQAEEERLLKIVQKELEDFMETMYQTLYGQFTRERSFLLNTMLYEQRGVLRDFTRKDTVDKLQKNYPSTYNFIRNIETGNQELTEMR